MEINNQAIDSEGTTRAQARKMLANLCENGFSGDVEKLAVALGRDEGEIKSFLDGAGEIDEDLLMKIRGIAQQRGLEIE